MDAARVAAEEARAAPPEWTRRIMAQANDADRDVFSAGADQPHVVGVIGVAGIAVGLF